MDELKVFVANGIPFIQVSPLINIRIDYSSFEQAIKTYKTKTKY